MPYLIALIVGILLSATHGWAQQQCIAFDPDYCVHRICGEGNGDCDPGQCAAGLVCVNDVGAQYGLPAHYDVCERPGGATVRPDPDYCVNNYCGIGDGDCDPGQCDEGTCVNDVGAEYGLPAHYDVCETTDGGGGTTPGEQQLQALIGAWDFRVTFGETITVPYRIERVEIINGIPVALGPNPYGGADLIVVARIEDLPDLPPLRYKFAMFYVEKIPAGTFICVTYAFNHSGNTVTGEVSVARASGPSTTNCSNTTIATGTFTGRRR